MVEKILILGGTAEAVKLAEELVQAGHDVTTSLAGRTREPSSVEGKLRVGGFGGAEGLAKYLTEKKFNRLIDATHPFANQISANAKRAAQSTGIAFEIHQRPAWEKVSGDQWIEVASLVQARDAIPQNSKVLLALGSQYIEQFAGRADVHFIVRMVDSPARQLSMPRHEIRIGKPGNVSEEIALLKDLSIDMIICRNSGGAASYAKIEAARKLQIPVIMIARPDG